MNTWVVSRMLFVATFIACLFDAPSLWAQGKLEDGEEVKVLYLGEWYDGAIVGKDRRMWVVDFVFANSNRREAFERANIRKQCEVDALDFVRGWESSSGKFKVDAALKAINGEEVVLIKTDMDEVTVPLSSLSTNDVTYVNKFKKQNDTAIAKGQIPARTPALPEIEDYSGGFTTIAAIAVSNDEQVPLKPVPDYLKEFSQSGMGFLMTRSRQELIAAIPVGGPEQLVLMTAREDNFHNRDMRFQSQVYWVSLKTKKVLSTVHITPEDFVVDYDPSNQRMLSIHRAEAFDDEKRDVFTLWNLKPGESAATPIQRWYGKVEGWPNSIFAKIVNENIVVAKTDSQSYTAWDVAEKKVAYSFKAGSFFDSPVVFTYDRNYLIVPEDGKLTVFNAVTGDVLFSTRVKDNHVSGANINAAGNRLVGLTERSLYVWDLTAPKQEPKVYPAPLIGNPFGSRIEWVDDDLVLAETHSERVLYRLSLELPVWSYRLETGAYWDNRDPLKNMVLNGLFFYVAQPRNGDGSIAVGAVRLPGPSVDEITKDIDRESLYMIKPGVAVAVQMKSVTNPSQVEQWLREKIEANGWVFDPNSEIVMHAEMGVGQTQSETYREFGLGGKETTVSFTPHFSTLVIKKGDLVIWQTGTSTGAPPISRADNIQAEVTAMQKPQLEFFKYVSIDPKIIDPKYSRGFGVSELSLRGIQVVSTTPPGRDENPADAESKMKDDQEKDRNKRRDNPGDGEIR